jgi:hypothetical protein
VLGLASLLLAGCESIRRPDTDHRDVWDAVFLTRHTRHVPVELPPDSLMSLAREVTLIEDEMRRDGSITVKAPDVWGEGNLLHTIQEYDALLTESVKKFDPSLQAYIARSDQLELQSASALGLAVSPAGSAPTPPASSQTTSISLSDAALKDLPDYEPAKLIELFKKQAQPTGGIGVEPTEIERQRSTFIQVNQALRRRNLGPDNARAAGYCLYKFNVPVSVLPGRETTTGFMGIVTLRARLHVDEASLRYAFPKLVIADLVENLAVVIDKDWGTPLKDDVAATVERTIQNWRELKKELEEESQFKKSVEQVTARMDALERSLVNYAITGDADPVWDALRMAEIQFRDLKKTVGEAESPLLSAQSELNAKAIEVLSQPGAADQADQMRTVVLPVTVGNPAAVYQVRPVEHVRRLAQKHFVKARPGGLELRAFLFAYLGQLMTAVESQELLGTGQEWILASAREIEKGGNIGGLAPTGTAQFDSEYKAWTDLARGCFDPATAAASWLVAVQAGIVDRNMKRILEELYREGELSPEDYELSQSDAIAFFFPDSAPAETLHLWQEIVEKTFPVHVFALDPEVEEQNVLDALSRRREIQLALAVSVAGGATNFKQRVALSRQLALDIEAIDLNRTMIAFNHDHDTFGWYFRPRVQAPPVESTNLGALARTLWSTGPTERYDMRNRQLEPGIRQGEVLIAMPSFVTRVDFEVTGNWERLARPGVTKRSYEEMLAQGGRIHQLKQKVCGASDAGCYRPGDHERLVSRVEQLEKMLGMQTYTVSVPYEYEVTGTDLFDTGDVHLRPVLHAFHGLEFLQAGGKEARLFLSGKNFHPTLTHVIIGGAEADTVANPDVEVEVVNRELLRVAIKDLNAALSADGRFVVRVGTPAGLSGPLEIPMKEVARPAAPPAGFALAGTPTWAAFATEGNWNFEFADPPRLPAAVSIKYSDSSASLLPDGDFDLVGRITARRRDGIELVFNDGQGGVKFVDTAPVHLSDSGVGLTVGVRPGGQGMVGADGLADLIRRTLQNRPVQHGGQPFTLSVVLYVKFSPWPVERVSGAITIPVTLVPKLPDAPGPALGEADSVRPMPESTSAATVDPPLIARLPGRGRR